jgi:hypothetical protein
MREQHPRPLLRPVEMHVEIRRVLLVVGIVAMRTTRANWCPSWVFFVNRIRKVTSGRASPSVSTRISYRASDRNSFACDGANGLTFRIRIDLDGSPGFWKT